MGFRSLLFNAPCRRYIKELLDALEILEERYHRNSKIYFKKKNIGLIK